MAEPLRAGYFVWYDPPLLFMSANLFFRSPHMSDFTVQELTLGQLLENTAARFPDTDAVIHADRELRQTWCATTILLLPHMRCSPNCAASGAGCSKSRGCRT